MSSYEVNPEGVTKAYHAISKVEPMMRKIIANFNTSLTSLGEPWGDDELGDQWSSIYNPALTKFNGSLNDVAVGIGELSLKFRYVASLYESVENANLS